MPVRPVRHFCVAASFFCAVTFASQSAAVAEDNPNTYSRGTRAASVSVETLQLPAGSGGRRESHAVFAEAERNNVAADGASNRPALTASKAVPVAGLVKPRSQRSKMRRGIGEHSPIAQR